MDKLYFSFGSWIEHDNVQKSVQMVINYFDFVHNLLLQMLVLLWARTVNLFMFIVSSVGTDIVPVKLK